MSTLDDDNWIITWVTPPGEIVHSTCRKAVLNDKADDSSDEPQFVIEIQVLRSKHYWLYGDKTRNIITDVSQEEEPVILKLFPVSFHDILSRKDVFRNCDFMPLLSSIHDYVGDMVPSNFIPHNFVQNLKQSILDKIYNDILTPQAHPQKDHYFVPVPIQVVKVVELFQVDEHYCGCLECRPRGVDGDRFHCHWGNGSMDTRLAREIIDLQLPTITYSSLFDAVNMKIFNHGDGKRLKNECSICLKEFENGISISKLPCSHVFHTKCIVNWFAKVTNCPLCRSRVDPRQSKDAQFETDDVESELSTMQASYT